jgi:hypothetical protein
MNLKARLEETQQPLYRGGLVAKYVDHRMLEYLGHTSEISAVEAMDVRGMKTMNRTFGGEACEDFWLVTHDFLQWNTREWMTYSAGYTFDALSRRP